MSDRWRAWIVSAVAVLVAAAGGAAWALGPVGSGAYGLVVESAAAEPFPHYPAVQPNVQFWKRVFSEWSLGQIVVHDLEYPAIVYEVIDLPGPAEERYTKEQRRFAEQQVELWEDRLRAIEHKIERGVALDGREKKWALLITTSGGTGAVEGAHRRVRTQRGLRERFRRGVEISFRYDGVFRQIFHDAGLPEELAYLPHVESSFQARARSSAGAVGIWQFTRGTGRKYLKINSAIDQRLDPVAATRAAAAYLEDAYAVLSGWPLALTAYNHGIGGMRRAAEAFDSDYERIFKEYRGRLFGFASKNFYAEFLAAMEIADAPERYFPEGFEPEPPFDLEEIVLEGRTTPGRLAKAYGLPLAELAAVNPAWTSRAVRSGLALPEGSSVWFPAGTAARLARAGRKPEYTLSGWVDRGGYYVVQPGDSLSVIAEAYGISLGRLRELNGIPEGASLIHVGQRLRLGDDAAAGVHVVRRGETLSTIARRYGMSLSELRASNGLAPNESLIRVGQTLRVRGDGGGPGFHVVLPGETLLIIALKYGVRLAELLHLNRLTERSIIYPGQKIRLPF